MLSERVANHRQEGSAWVAKRRQNVQEGPDTRAMIVRKEAKYPGDS